MLQNVPIRSASLTTGLIKSATAESCWSQITTKQHKKQHIVPGKQLHAGWWLSRFIHTVVAFAVDLTRGLALCTTHQGSTISFQNSLQARLRYKRIYGPWVIVRSGCDMYVLYHYAVCFIGYIGLAWAMHPWTGNIGCMLVIRRRLGGFVMTTCSSTLTSQSNG